MVACCRPPLLSPPQNPGQEVTRPPRPPLPVLDKYWDVLSKGSGSPQLHPGPSEGSLPSPPGGSVNLDTLLSTGSQPLSPSPPQGPAQEVTCPSSPGPLLDEFSASLFVSVDSGFVLSKSQVNLLRDASGILPTMSTEWPMKHQIEQADTFATSQITFSSGNRPRPHTQLSSPWSWVWTSQTRSSSTLCSNLSAT